MKRLILLFLWCALAMPAWAGTSQPADFSGPASAEIDRAVRSVCSKDVVLLGEDADHAGATTIVVKTVLVERLVRQCGFRGVVIACEAAIGRRDNGDYDDAHPFDAEALRQLRGCLRGIGGALYAKGRKASPDLRAMVDSYSSFLDFVKWRRTWPA